jgi:hypothetical protein
MNFLVHYFDDSGAEDFEVAAFGWVAVDAGCRLAAMNTWMDFRRQLFEKAAIPTDTELHAVKFLQGRGRPSLNDDWNLLRRNRHEVTRTALGTIASLPGVEVGSAFRRTRTRREDFRREQQSLYAAAVSHLDEGLARRTARGLIVMDGNGTDFGYHSAHRSLAQDERRLIEDPFFVDSQANQWIQMADIVAYTAFQAVARQESRSFMWNWHSEFFANPPLAL